jgi:hypothetical protein
MDIVENIERYIAGTGLTPGTRTRLVRARDEIVRLRKNQLTPAPEQPAQQEPEWYHFVSRGEDCFVPYEGQAPADATRLYTRPQAREPLTDEQRSKMYRDAQMRGDSIMLRRDYEQGITDTEAAHGITSGAATLGEKK